LHSSTKRLPPPTSFTSTVNVVRGELARHRCVERTSDIGQLEQLRT